MQVKDISGFVGIVNGLAISLVLGVLVYLYLFI